MQSNDEGLDSKPIPADAGSDQAGRRRCPVLLSNLWKNTKPTMPTAIRFMVLVFQILIVVVGCLAGIDIYKLDDPSSAPILHYAVVAFGISELLSLLFALRKPSADA
jgi:hypothetical protein